MRPTGPSIQLTGTRSGESGANAAGPSFLPLRMPLYQVHAFSLQLRAERDKRMCRTYSDVDENGAAGLCAGGSAWGSLVCSFLICSMMYLIE